ncbi:hypothetical protein M153_7300021390 [Pseudoloma neurophilia]|uniref:Uncharacterized protein n=1 Tax=Pseudoloma neurophilia TaxID=146866 RepID=A0A0R0M0B1_9MICR|nr:hypothetical protein M153_7300021390 [Pseudoloma neurophilia]
MKSKVLETLKSEKERNILRNYACIFFVRNKFYIESKICKVFKISGINSAHKSR